MRRRAFIDLFVLIILAAIALAFLLYLFGHLAAPHSKAVPAPAVKPAERPQSQHIPATSKRDH